MGAISMAIAAIEKQPVRCIRIGPPHMAERDTGLGHFTAFGADIFALLALQRIEEILERQRAEEALLRSEAYLAEAQRVSLTGSFGWDVSSGQIFWSEETFRILECDRTVQGYAAHCKHHN